MFFSPLFVLPFVLVVALYLLAASIRSPLHVTQAAMIGAHVATIPMSVIRQLLKHPLTDLGLEKFLADNKKNAEKAK